MRELKDGIRSKVRLDIHGRVHKHFRGTDADKRAANEAAILKALEERGCPYVPRLLDFFPDENYIVTTNCGQPAPGISRKKSDALFAELEREYGVRHDDPEPRNVTYSQPLGRFCLIDFELAELLPDPTHSSDTESAGIWRVTWASRSRQGNGHKANDDAVLILGVHPEDTQTLAADGEELLDPIQLVLAVSDGMGGGNAGEFASRLIMSWIKRHAKDLYDNFKQASQDPAPLEDLLVSAHRGINQLASEADNLHGMGATVTLAWLSPGMLHLAHIGDCRLYLCREGTTTQISEDHVRVWRRFQRGELKEFQYRTHPRRSALYDVLGGGHRGIHPQLLSHPIQSGDRLLLCSDGIVDGLWERPLAEELSTPGEPRLVADRILARAAQNDGRDDCTLIVADVRSL